MPPWSHQELDRAFFSRCECAVEFILSVVVVPPAEIKCGGIHVLVEILIRLPQLNLRVELIVISVFPCVENKTLVFRYSAEQRPSLAEGPSLEPFGPLFVSIFQALSQNR